MKPAKKSATLGRRGQRNRRQVLEEWSADRRAVEVQQHGRHGPSRLPPQWHVVAGRAFSGSITTANQIRIREAKFCMRYIIGRLFIDTAKPAKNSRSRSSAEKTDSLKKRQQNFTSFPG